MREICLTNISKMIIIFVSWLANCSDLLLPDGVIVVSFTSTHLTYMCNCPTSMMIVKRAVCGKNDTWLPQVLCGEGEGDCTEGTTSGGTYL